MTDREKAEEYADECFKGNDKDTLYYRTILITGYLDGLAEGRKETIKKIVGVINDNNSTYGDLRESLGIKWADTDLEKENAELQKDKEWLDNTNNEQTKVILELQAQIEKMKKSCLDVMKVQGINLTDDYMAGMYNGMVAVYNSCFLNGFNELEMDFCSKNENGKWELAE